MSKKLISTFFSILFMALISAPSIIVAIDDSIDVSILYGSAEEEEKESEKNNTIELLVIESDKRIEEFLFLSNEIQFEYRFTNYPIPHRNLISPPPDFFS